jgi:hypothetical protein
VTFYSTIRGTQRTPQSYGYNSTDRPHNIAISASQSLPWGVQLSVIARYLSGTPISASAGVDLDGDGVTSGDRPRGIPPYVGRGDVAEQLTLMNQYRASIGLAPATLDMLKLMPRKEIDMRMNKTFAFRDQRMQVFLEAFNLTNMVNWVNGTGNMRSSTFLVSRPGGTARQIQWGARYSF